MNNKFKLSYIDKDNKLNEEYFGSFGQAMIRYTELLVADNNKNLRITEQ